MSENPGVHVQLTAEASNFSQVLSAARQKLADLAVEERKIKTDIAAAEKELTKQSAAFGKDSTEAKKASTALAALYKKEYELRGNIKSVTDDINRQTNAFAQNANQGKITADTLKSGFLMLKGLALGYAGKTLYEALIGGNSEFEQYMTSFEVLLQSADKAQTMVDDLTKFAAKTPLEMTDTTKAANMLLGYGVAAEDLIEIMGRLGDLAQGNAEKLDRVSLAYGQMLAKGKVTGEELRQMVEAQVPLLQGLADYLNKTTAEVQDMISDGTVGIDDLNGAIKAMTSEGGQFFGMMEKQSQTMSGLLSTMSDNAAMFAREVGEETFEYLKGTLQELMDTIEQMDDDGSLSEIAGEIGENIGTAIKFVGSFIKLLWDMRGVIVTVGGAFVAWKSITGIINGITAATVACRTAAITLKAIKEADIGLDTIKNVLLGKSIILRNAETGAITVETAAKAKETLATQGATGAQVAFNAAILANPYVLAATLILGVVAALGSYIAMSNMAADAAEGLNQETQSLMQSYKDAIGSIDKATASEVAQAEKVKALKDRLYELSDELEKGTLTTDEATAAKKEMNSIVDTLNSNIPNLKLSIDNETGAWNKQRSEIDLLTEAFYKLTYAKAMASAYEAKINEASRTIADSEATIKKEQEKAKAPLKKTSSGAVVFYTAGEQNTIVRDAMNAKSQAENDIKSYTEEMAKNIQEYDSLLGAVGVSNSSSSSSSSSTKSSSKSSSKKTDEAEKNRKEKVEAYKADIEEIERLDKRWNENQRKLDRMSDAEYLQNIANRADRYRKYADEVTTLSYATEEEKAKMRKEYIEAAEDADIEYYEFYKKLVDNEKTTNKEMYDAMLSEGKKYISDCKNGYKQWAEGDDEREAIARLMARIEEAYRQGLIDFDTFIHDMDELSMQLYDMEKDNIIAAAKEQEQILKDKYQHELDMKVAAAEKEIEIAQNKAQAEKDAVNEAADNELKRIDELIQARKEAREDEDYNLRMRRLQTKLAYEHDEDNRLALQKEIIKLQKEIDDTNFERAMERQKEMIEENRDTALANIEEQLDRTLTTAERKITVANSRYAEQTSGTSLAAEIAKSFNYNHIESIYEALGENINSEIGRAIKGLYDGLMQTLNSVAGSSKSSYDYSNNSRNVAFYNSITTALTAGQLDEFWRRLRDRMELEGL